MSKITAHEILTAISDVRKHTCPPTGKVVARGIDEIVVADSLLLDLQERILDAYGNEPQDTTLAS